MPCGTTAVRCRGSNKKKLQQLPPQHPFPRAHAHPPRALEATKRNYNFKRFRPALLGARAAEEATKRNYNYKAARAGAITMSVGVEKQQKETTTSPAGNSGGRRESSCFARV